MFPVNDDRQVEAARAVSQARRKRLQEYASDPFLGYPDLKSAMKDAKYTSQCEALARLLNKENLFISGLAGSGKTTVINRFVQFLDAQTEGAVNIAVTASTGIAATLIGGKTIHSWSGLGIASELDLKDLPPMIFSRMKEIRETDVLIIDEISMLPAYFFIMLDSLLKHVRRNNDPFGGVQMVVIGDFMQLPPVQKEGNDLDCRFAIETKEWRAANFGYCFLDKTYRATDDKLHNLLVEMINGEISEESKRNLKARLGKELPEGKTFTKLYTTNNNVDKYNREQLAQNPNPSVFMKMKTIGNKTDVEKVIKRYKIEEEFEIKLGAVVMLTKNIRYNNVLYSNGSLGVVVGFTDPKNYFQALPKVKFNDGSIITIEFCYYEETKTKEYVVDALNAKNEKFKKTIKMQEVIAEVSQVPLKLGYAITVHKSQGQTFDGVSADLSRCFQDGLGYVALSRVRSLDDLVLTGFNDKAYVIGEKARKINKFVKHHARKERVKFLEDIELYDSLMTVPFSVMMVWEK